VVLERHAVAAAFSGAGDRLAVFVHGLCGTEHSWNARSGPDSVCYGDLLEADLGQTPVYVRYNTGLHVSENGRALSALMERLTAVWPTPVHEIALVGHSMGGLVVRSACHHGSVSRARWTQAVRHVACLGSPHLGAPLEQATGALCRSLAVLPETRPFARLVNQRSARIKDLRSGSLVDEDRLGRDADAFLRGACRESRSWRPPRTTSSP
jgi:pimeloyl-ACP methyl ester carboxylesterase